MSQLVACTEQTRSRTSDGLPVEEGNFGSLGPLDGWAFPDGASIRRSGGWLSVTGTKRTADGLHQGWKLHLSARPSTLKQTVDRVIPVLLAAGCDFKVIASPELLRDFNAGLHGAGAVGKAVTVYPHQDHVVELACRLADALEGFEGPQINSDRRFRQDAPVYYRFGPFSPRFRLDDSGHVDVTLQAPDGRVTSGLACETYFSPDWTEDPFILVGTPGARLPSMDGAPVIGDHYQMVGAIARTPRGTSYRALDLQTATRVVVKEARAFVNETADGDARAYLRNERRVLVALDELPGVPRVIDHFAYGNDEFLVTTDLGASDLRSDVLDNGVFAVESDSPRNVIDLARTLVRMLDDVHQRGVIYRDLAPKNIVALSAGGWGLVDFELSRLNGVQRYGWTPGYSHERQRRNEPGVVEDDYFSLGATMFYAITGLDPVIIDRDFVTNIARTVSCLTAVCGEELAIVRLIRDLLGSDRTTQCAAVQQLRATTFFESQPRAPLVRPHPSLESVFRHTRDAVLGHAMAIVADDARERSLPPSVVAYAGTAGIVMELVQHSGAVVVARELAGLTALVAQTVSTPTGLLFGRMGISLALHAVANATDDVHLHGTAHGMVPSADDVAKESRVDVAHGLAGLGIGYLVLSADPTHASQYQAMANLCAERLCAGMVNIDEQLRALPAGNPAHGISIADGFAHGRAGIAYFLLAHAANSGSEASRACARQLVDAIADLVPGLVARAESRRGRPMSGSWCQGLAGIGATLLRGAHWFQDERLLSAARMAAAGCKAIAPRVGLVTQCCGLAGIGELLLDLAFVTGDTRFRDEALDTLGLMLLRSGGSRTAPSFPDSSMATETPGWASGATGVLSFLRRLVDPSSARLWMADSPAIFGA